MIFNRNHQSQILLIDNKTKKYHIGKRYCFVKFCDSINMSTKMFVTVKKPILCYLKKKVTLVTPFIVLFLDRIYFVSFRFILMLHLGQEKIYHYENSCMCGEDKV